MQVLMITGRVGGNAETRQAGNGTVTNFSLAVEQGWGQNKTTNWFRVAIWGERGSKLQPHIKKGDKVAVTGDLVIGEYNGKPQYEVRASDVDCFMSGKADSASGGTEQRGAGGSQPQSNTAFDPELDDDVPF